MWGFLVIYAINPGKSCFSQNLHHIRISSQFVSFFLTRCQMRAHKTKTCLVQCHAYRYRSLQINYIILHQYKIKHIYRNYLTGTVTCVGFISVLISEKRLERKRENLVSKIAHQTTAHTRDLQIFHIRSDLTSYPDHEKYANHLLTCH